MRVKKDSIARWINFTLKHHFNERHDKEELIDNIFYQFARLHGIGVTVKNDRARTTYEFMIYPYESHCDSNGDYKRSSTCRSTAVDLDIFTTPNITGDMMFKTLDYVEDKLGLLRSWVYYLVEEPKKVSNLIVDDLIQSRIDVSEFYPKEVYHIPSRGCGKSNWISQMMNEYCKNDVKVTIKAAERLLKVGALKSTFDIDKVIFNDPATIVIFKDGTKTVVKAQDGETYDPEKGLAMALCKKTMGNTRDYYNVFRKYMKQWEKENPEKDTGEILIHANASLNAFAIASNLHVEQSDTLPNGHRNFEFINGDGERYEVTNVSEFIPKALFDKICNSICDRFGFKR